MSRAEASFIRHFHQKYSVSVTGSESLRCREAVRKKPFRDGSIC